MKLKAWPTLLKRDSNTGGTDVTYTDHIQLINFNYPLSGLFTQI